MVIGNLLILIA